MATYRTTSRLQLRTPSGAVGEAPDGPGGMATLADDIDGILGVGGAETAANLAAITAIPAARCFDGKLAYAADTKYLYRYVAGVWTLWDTPDVAFTPAWAGGVTVGNGSQYGRWKLTGGRLLDFAAELTLGSTSAISGAPQLTLPNGFTLNNIAGVYRLPVGQSVFYDQSAGNEYYGIASIGAATTVIARMLQVTGTLLNVRDASPTVPMTWAVNDQIGIQARVFLA